MKIEKLISPFIESQFPLFYQEEGPQFIEFVKAYYSWLESQGEILHESRSLLEYRDIDTTLNNFLLYFKNKYINSLPENILADKPLLIKYILDLYRSKGSDRSYALLFKILFNEDIEVYAPGKDVFKLSDGDWVVPRYIELTDCPHFVKLIGNKIYSSGTFSTAVVDNYFTKVVNNKFINVLILNDLKGNFKFGEKILCEAVPEITINNSPIIIGSLSSIGITDGGINYNIGDILNVNNSGEGGLARVVSTVDKNGQVEFTLIDGGSGFSLDAVVNVVGETREIDSITLENFITLTDGSVEGVFDLYEKIYFSNNVIANNEIQGAVLDIESNTVTGNTLLSGTLTVGDLVYFQSNNLIIVSTSNVNTSTDTITITNHGYITGAATYYVSNGPAIETIVDGASDFLHDNIKYFVRVINSNSFKLYTTLAYATAGGSTGLINLTSVGNNSQTFKNSPLNSNVIVRTVYSKPNEESFIITEKPSFSSPNATVGIISAEGSIKDINYTTGNVVISNSSVSTVIINPGLIDEEIILPFDYLTNEHKIIASNSQSSAIVGTSDDIRYVVTVKPIQITNNPITYKGHGFSNRDTVRLDYILGVESLNIENYGYYVKVVNSYAFELFTDYDLDANTTTNYLTDENKKANHQVPVLDNPNLYYISNTGFVYQNPGGVGATFKIGSIVNKEIYRINTDKIADYIDERMESYATVGGGFDIHPSGVVGTFSSGDVIIMENVKVKQLDASKVSVSTIMSNGEFLFNTALGINNLTVVNSDETYIEVKSTNPSILDNGVNHPLIRDSEDRYYAPGIIFNSSGGSAFHLDAILDDKIISLIGDSTFVNSSVVQVQLFTGYPVYGETIKSIGNKFEAYVGNDIDQLTQGKWISIGNPCRVTVPAFSSPPTNTPVFFEVIDDESIPVPTLPYGLYPDTTYYVKYIDENEFHLSATPFINVLRSKVNITDNTINIPNHGFVNGDEIYYVSFGDPIEFSTGIGYIEDEVTYYVRRADAPNSANYFKIYDTKPNALAGGATGLLNLTTTGNDNQTFRKTALVATGEDPEKDGFGNPIDPNAYQYPPYDTTRYVIYYDKAHATVSKVDRITHYDFPKVTVAPYYDRENMDTYIRDALTYVDKEVGDIARLKNINTGEQYSNDPKVVIIEPLIYELREKGKNGGYKGFNANVSAKAGYSNGIVTAIEIVDSGYGYERDQQVALTNDNNPYAIVGTTVIDTGGKGKGYWRDNKGFLSDQIYLEDSYYYQKFSYEIIASRMLNTYEKYVKDLIHPSGMKLFGRFVNKNELEQDNLEIVFSSLNKDVISTVIPEPPVYQILTVDNSIENVSGTRFTSDNYLKTYVNGGSSG